MGRKMVKHKIIEALPGKFCTSEALHKADSLGLSRQSAFNALKEGVENGVLYKPVRNLYHKWQ